MVKHFDLVEVPFAYIERIKTKPFRRLFKSTNPEYKRLILVDKETEGRKPMHPMRESMLLRTPISSVPMWIASSKNMHFTAAYCRLFLLKTGNCRQWYNAHGKWVRCQRRTDSRCKIAPYSHSPLPELRIYAFLSDRQNGLVGH